MSERTYNITRTNLVERSLLVMSQLSTRFAVQYHWAIHSMLEELQAKCTRKCFDTTKFARCLKLAGNLERCMAGRKRPEEEAPRQENHVDTAPKLEIMTSVGGKIINDEMHAIYEEEPCVEETNQQFFDTILSTALDNAGQYCHIKKSENDSSDVAAEFFEPEQALPFKEAFGGVLLFKRQTRKYGRRKTWKRRFFAIEETMLNCYSRRRKLLRSISLEGATLWKGPQKKYPHSFIVANNSSMFYLQASSDQQKSVWKRKLREIIDADTLPHNASESQKERHTRYEAAKWFGRMLGDTSYELGCVVHAGREEFLYDDFFDLDIPSQVYWPWRNSNTPATDDAPEKSVYVVLPHFSRLLSDFWNNLDRSPRFEASFILSTEKRAHEHAGIYEKFLKEGRQGTDAERPEMPESLKEVLQGFHSQRIIIPKDVDGGSITGESTSGMSSGSSEGGGTDGESEEMIYKRGHRSVATDDGTCDSDKSSGMSSTGSIVEEIEIELGDDISLFDFSATGVETDEESEEEDFQLCVELELMGDPQAKKDERSSPAEDDDEISVTGSVAKCSIIPQKTKGLVALRTKRYQSEEMMAVQLARYYESLYTNSLIWLRPPREQRLNKDTMIVEVPKKAITISQAKHPSVDKSRSLLQYFVETFGEPESEPFECAQMCFTQSLAGLSIMTYLFGISHRHDDKLMLDQRGHIIMPDFSAVFSAATEISPFKLTRDYIDVMGGPHSDTFQHFQDLFVSGIKLARGNATAAISFSQVLASGGSRRCQKKAVGYLRKRLLLATPDDMLDEKIASLMEHAKRDFIAAAKDVVDVVLPKPRVQSDDDDLSLYSL